MRKIDFNLNTYFKLTSINAAKYGWHFLNLMKSKWLIYDCLFVELLIRGAYVTKYKIL